MVWGETIYYDLVNGSHRIESVNGCEGYPRVTHQTVVEVDG